MISNLMRKNPSLQDYDRVLKNTRQLIDNPGLIKVGDIINNRPEYLYVEGFEKDVILMLSVNISVGEKDLIKIQPIAIKMKDFCTEMRDKDGHITVEYIGNNLGALMHVQSLLRKGLDEQTKKPKL